MRVVLVLSLVIAAVSALPTQNDPSKIVGGSVTNINQYPFAVVLLASASGAGTFSHACGGAVLNNRSVLTAAHCFMFYSFASQWRSRVGSTFASSGGTVLNSAQIIRHGSFSTSTLNNDVAIIRVSGTINFGNNVGPGSIAGANYNLGDNQAVWAIGWGATCFRCGTSEQLRHVQIWTVNQATCANRYAELRHTITAQMLCSGWLDVGGRDQCQGDSGGPLIHNRVIVGVCSWGEECALARYPGVNARVSSFSSWITSNA